MTPVSVELPLRLRSSANLREHWARRAERVAGERAVVRFMLSAQRDWKPDGGPCVVTLTRVAPRELDDDNLAHAFKAIRDGVADALGVDDRDPRVTWGYAQRRGPYAIVVEVREKKWDGDTRQTLV